MTSTCDLFFCTAPADIKSGVIFLCARHYKALEADIAEIEGAA